MFCVSYLLCAIDCRWLLYVIVCCVLVVVGYLLVCCVLCVVCCLLIDVCRCVLFVDVRCLLLDIRRCCMLCAARCSLFVACYMLRCMLLVGRCFMFVVVVWCLLSLGVICRLLVVDCCVSRWLVGWR